MVVILYNVRFKIIITF